MNQIFIPMYNLAKALVFILLSGAGIVSLNAQPGLLWSRDFFCALDNRSSNFVTKPITDLQGNIYVAGSLLVDQNFLNRAPVIIKMNPQGDVIWQYAHPRYAYTPNDPPPWNSTFTDLTFDHEGNLLAAGIAPFDTTVFGNKPFVVKINPDGQMLWQKIMLSDIQTFSYFGNKVTSDPEGNVYLTSLSRVSPNYPGFLWKFNASGEQMWQYEFTLGVRYKYYIYHLEYLPVSNTILVAGDIELTSSYWQIFISKHNIATGAQTKETRFATNPTSYLEAVYADTDENIYVSTYSDNGVARIKKFDNLLEKKLEMKYYPDGSYDNNFGQIISLSDGNLLAAGYSYATKEPVTGRAVFLKFSPDGVALDTLVMDASGEEYFYDVAELNGELFFTGATTNNNDETALKLWRTDMQGTILGTHVYEKPGVNWSEGLWLHTNEDHVYVTGTTWKGPTSGISLLKTSAEVLNTMANTEQIIEKLQIYPNPASDGLWIEFENPSGRSAQVRVVNLLGQEVVSQEIHGQGHIITRLDVSMCEAGVYYLSIQTGVHTIGRKVVIRK